MSVRVRDRLRLCVDAVREHRLRSALSVLGIAIGIAAVIVLVSIGGGTRAYISAQFAQFGTNLLQVTPGKTETIGLPGVLGGTTHKLTLADATALLRVRGVEAVVPTIVGQGRVEAGERGRTVPVIATTGDAPRVWKMGVRQGTFLPDGDPRRAGGGCVLGPKAARELFGEASPVGKFVRVAGSRLRVLGVTELKGAFLTFDFDDLVYVDLATGMRLFDRDELMEIDVSFASRAAQAEVERGVRAVLTERHGGREDFTVLTQSAMLDTFDRVLRAITLAVAGIGAISLLVGAVGIATVMWIAVGERTHEIGLLRALGATGAHVQQLFLLEAAALCGIGGATGLALGYGLAHVLHVVARGLPVAVTPAVALLALALSVVTGLVSGWAPARRAARMDPIEALRAE